MVINFQKIKEKFAQSLSSYLPLLPLIRIRGHIILFRLLLLFVSFLLIQITLLFYINKKIILSAVDISNPIDIFFDTKLNVDEIQDIVEEIRNIPGVSQVSLITSDTLKMEVIPQEPILSEAEIDGLSPFQNIAAISVSNGVGNPQNRERIISKLESINGVSIVSGYNQLRFQRLDYIDKIADRLMTIFLICSFFILIITTIISTVYSTNLSIAELEYIQEARKIFPELSFKKVFIYEGLLSGLLIANAGCVILCLLWVLSLIFLPFKFIFFNVWQVLALIIDLPIILIIINMIIIKLYKDKIK